MKLDCTPLCFIYIMNIFEKYFRTISTREVTFTKEQMADFRIINIFNSFGHIDHLNENDAEALFRNHKKNGSICLIETATKGNLYIISLIIFEDLLSRNVFALQNIKQYDLFPDLLTLYN
jgi:hypothetical protein